MTTKNNTAEKKEDTREKSLIEKLNIMEENNMTTKNNTAEKKDDIMEKNFVEMWADCYENMSKMCRASYFKACNSYADATEKAVEMARSQAKPEDYMERYSSWMKTSMEMSKDSYSNMMENMKDMGKMASELAKNLMPFDMDTRSSDVYMKMCDTWASAMEDMSGEMLKTCATHEKSMKKMTKTYTDTYLA
ncbi:hypothetical protein KKA03_03155 [archaeon]|nr:hypothetical protein [archaeon]